MHNTCKHLGVESTLNYVRQSGCWILQARQAIRKVIENCILCHRYNSRPFRIPSSPELPKERVFFVLSFDNTGMDFTGHFLLENQLM